MWKETAIFSTWDDYGGFYDRAAAAGRRLGFGIRAPTGDLALRSTAM